jgi:hypothetical protein
MNNNNNTNALNKVVSPGLEVRSTRLANERPIAGHVVVSLHPERGAPGTAKQSQLFLSQVQRLLYVWNLHQNNVENHSFNLKTDIVYLLVEFFSKINNPTSFVSTMFAISKPILEVKIG